MKGNIKERLESQEDPVQNLVDDPQWHCTLKGRVVYNRKKHYFKTKDLIRIWNKVKFVIPFEAVKDLSVIGYLRELNTELTEIILPFSFTATPQEEEELKNFLDEVNIILLTEIVEKIPFIPNRLEEKIAEFIYWNVYRLVDRIIRGGN